VSVEPFWWNTIQKTMTIRYTTISAPIRLASETSSIAVRCGASTGEALTGPTAARAPFARPSAANRPRSACSTYFLNRHRIDTEMAMPNAATANAGWKPQRWLTNSATTGAMKAPTLIPM
jgi:hypothetical protein